MGIYDRDYYRQEDAKVARRNEASTSAVYTLLAITGFVVFLEIFANSRNERSPFFHACSFSVAKFQAGEVWRAATYPIVCDEPMAYLFQLCVLLIFGRPYERRFGSWWFLGTYFGSAVLAAVTAWGFTAAGMLGGDPFSLIDGPASALMGLLAATFLTLGRQETTLHFPSPMGLEMRWVALAAAIIGMLSVADSPRAANGRFLAAFGLLAGLGIGQGATTLVERRSGRLDRPRWSSRRRDDEPITVKFPTGKAKAVPADNVDDLLQKISTHGIDSLSEAEKERLNAASASRRQRGKAE